MSHFFIFLCLEFFCLYFERNVFHLYFQGGKKWTQFLFQSTNKRIPDTQKYKKEIASKKDKRKAKKGRHDDKTSTHGRFEKRPTVVIWAYLTPLTSSINIETFITMSKKHLELQASQSECFTTHWTQPCL